VNQNTSEAVNICASRMLNLHLHPFPSELSAECGCADTLRTEPWQGPDLP